MYNPISNQWDLANGRRQLCKLLDVVFGKFPYLIHVLDSFQAAVDEAGGAKKHLPILQRIQVLFQGSPSLDKCKCFCKRVMVRVMVEVPNVSILSHKSSQSQNCFCFPWIAYQYIEDVKCSLVGLLYSWSLA